MIIVDNDSADGSVDYLEKLEERFENIYFVRAGRNLGFCKACNIGARKARGKFLLF